MSKEYLEAKDLQANFVKCFKELLTKTDKDIIVVNISREMAQDMVNLYEKYLTINPSEATQDVIYVSGYEYTRVRDRFKDVLNFGKEEKETNPSEALECLEVIGCGREDNMKFREVFEKEYNTILKALIKSQEQEKVIIELCEYCGMDNLYPYDNLEEIEITFKDTFDNYQRQRIESLGRLNKQEKVLKIIFEKGLSLAERDMIKHSENYEQYCIKCSWCKMKNASSQKTKEEFELLKRYFNE